MNEQHSRYNSRSNSITSFGSFTSASHIPRSSSTTDLVTVDASFMKSSRTNRIPKSHSAQSIPRSGLRVTQSHTNLSSSRMDSLQSTSTNDLLIFNYPHSRKNSLNSVQNSFNTNHRQYPPSPSHNQPNSGYRPSNAKRRPNQRHDVPFTFPNGERYIPRSKQRSLTDIKSLNDYPQHNLQPPLNQYDNYQKFQPSPRNSLMVPQARPQQNFHQHSGSTTTSNSTSPSPSRNSRTESMNESTPSSSIDDLTSQLYIKDPNPTEITPVESISNIPILDMIEENTSGEVASKDLESFEPKIEPIKEETDPTKKESKPIKAPVKEAKSAAPKPIRSAPVIKPISRLSIIASPSSSVQTVKITPKEKKKSGLKSVLANLFKRKKKAPEVVKVKPAQPVKIKKPVKVEDKVETKEFKSISPVVGLEINDQCSEFSFDGLDENINIQRNSSYFDSEEVLASMFAGLNGKPKPSITQEIKLSEINKTSEKDKEDDIISFDDLELIEKMIQYGETPFPDLKSPDLGESQRKKMRSKSIERRKSIRSVNSTRSKLSNNSATNNTFTEQDEVVIIDDHILEVLISDIKEPNHELKPVNSILKKSDDCKTKKKVEFTNKIYINQTYGSNIYDRHSQPLTNLKINPQFIQQVRYELNDFKRSMVVHELSKKNTHFFPS